MKIIKQKYTIKAPVARVWQAFVDPKIIDSWGGGPAKMDDHLKARLEDLAIQVFRLLIGRDYGRVDVRVDSQNRIFVLEYNPNPDISADAGFAKAVKAAGLTYREFVELIIHQALKRKSNGSHQENDT